MSKIVCKEIFLPFDFFFLQMQKCVDISMTLKDIGWVTFHNLHRICKKYSYGFSVA